MEKRKIGKLEVSAVGLGCMGIIHAGGAPMIDRKLDTMTIPVFGGH